MPYAYFVDAWFLIALIDRSDSSHHAATRLIRRLVGVQLVTHDAIFFEVLAFFSEEGSHARREAVSIIRRALYEMTVIAADRALFLRALDHYAARPDKEYSLTDCLSMIVMEDRGIRHVLSNDHHFTQAGFLLVNE